MGMHRMGLASVVLALALTGAATHGAAAQTPPCAFRGASSALAERAAPLDSVLIRLGDAEAKLCYGRPSAGGVPQVGFEVPYGSPWQMGANEPTTLHLPFPAALGDVDLPAGSYSLYAIPEAEAWTVVVNGNPNRWGVPIGPEVRAADLGSFRAPTRRLTQVVDRLTFRFEGTDASVGSLVFEWERTGLSIPLSRR